MRDRFRDRISCLSNELLCQILSFLPTQEAVATCVLSKKWRPIWTSVPVLDFDDETYLINNRRPANRFETFVYGTLQARDVQQAITSLCLKYKVRDHERASVHVTDWVNTVVPCGIENLEITLDSSLMVNLRCNNIFSCKTLVSLKLEKVFLSACSSVELPSLKSLRLNAVKFEEPQYLMELLYGCPMLEDLIAFYVDYAHGRHPLLKERVKILPKLVTAIVWNVGMAAMDDNSTNILLKAISNVQFLTLGEDRVNVDDVVSEFPHLTNLDLNLEKARLMLLMLKNCPKLETLDFIGQFEDEDVLLYSHSVPECFTSCLTRCWFHDDQEDPGNEVQFAKHILQNSTFLKSMTIFARSPNHLEVQKELTLCPRKSKLCKVSCLKGI